MFGTDYPTPDGTCIRDYIHVSDLAAAHRRRCAYLRRGGSSATFNCGYGRGASVLEVINSVKKASGRDFPVELRGRRPGDPAALVADVSRIRVHARLAARNTTTSTPSSPTRWPGRSCWASASSAAA